MPVFKEQRDVDAKYVDVCEILPRKENGQIKVSVVLVWKVPAFVNPTETSSLEMVLIDGKLGSHLLKKSCSFFVAQSKATNAGPHPIEFDCLVGHKMLFAVDLSSKNSPVSGGSYRVKKICMDSKVIESFYSQCPFRSPSKAISGFIGEKIQIESCNAGDSLVDDIV
ncbi:replication protein A 70 kDa DNA-binding subunit [Trifolium repens]|nr:replication protein A 70 kDa DNA-binding subunit [Trifolium repens]